MIAIHVFVVDNDDIFFAFDFVVGCLNGVITAFFALAFIEFTDCIYFLDNLAINLDSFLRVKLFFLEH